MVDEVFSFATSTQEKPRGEASCICCCTDSRRSHHVHCHKIEKPHRPYTNSNDLSRRRVYPRKIDGNMLHTPVLVLEWCLKVAEINL